MHWRHARAGLVPVQQRHHEPRDVGDKWRDLEDPEAADRFGEAVNNVVVTALCDGAEPSNPAMLDDRLTAVG
jgi:hypothetical protein